MVLGTLVNASIVHGIGGSTAGSQGEIPNSVNRWNAEGKKGSELAELSSCEDDVEILKMRIVANKRGGIATWYRTFRVAMRPSITLRSSVFSASKHLQFHRPNVKCFIGLGAESPMPLRPRVNHQIVPPKSSSCYRIVSPSY